MKINVPLLPKFGVYLYVMCFMGRPHEPIGPVKIGITGNVQSRLAAVQTGCHQRLEVLAAFNLPDRDAARLVESELHRLGKNWRLEGEWFDIDPIIALEVACGVVRLFLDGRSDELPSISAAEDEISRVGLLHFEMQVPELRKWRAHYSSTSNVTPLSKTA